MSKTLMLFWHQMNKTQQLKINKQVLGPLVVTVLIEEM